MASFFGGDEKKDSLDIIAKIKILGYIAIICCATFRYIDWEPCHDDLYYAVATDAPNPAPVYDDYQCYKRTVSYYVVPVAVISLFMMLTRGLVSWFKLEYELVARKEVREQGRALLAKINTASLEDASVGKLYITTAYASLLEAASKFVTPPSLSDEPAE